MLELTQTPKQGGTTFLGEVTPTQLISADTVASNIGLFSGTSISGGSAAGWLKFNYNGKIIYISKRPVKHTVSWNQIYAAGAVYGDDTNGRAPGPTPKLQNARVTAAGKSHRVRMLHATTNGVSGVSGNELFDLFLKVLATASGGTGELAKYAGTDLGVSVGSWTIDEVPSTANRYLMETTTTTPFRIVLTGLGAASTFSFAGWRPVLEEI